jgi:hypothetical protein
MYFLNKTVATHGHYTSYHKVSTAVRRGTGSAGGSSSLPPPVPEPVPQAEVSPRGPLHVRAPGPRLLLGIRLHVRVRFPLRLYVFQVAAATCLGLVCTRIPFWPANMLLLGGP